MRPDRYFVNTRFSIQEDKAKSGWEVDLRFNRSQTLDLLGLYWQLGAVEQVRLHYPVKVHPEVVGVVVELPPRNQALAAVEGEEEVEEAS